jgi:hypothetical protein
LFSCSILVSASRLSLCFGLASLELFFFNSNIHGCFNASSAFNLSAGSHLKQNSFIKKLLVKIKQKCSYSRQRETKSIKFVSFVLSICASDLEPTLRFLKSFVFKLRGMFLESKNSFLLDASASMCAGGKSITSIIIASCSASFSPGNIG